MPEQSIRFNERVLVALVGLSPAVITETIYALATESAPFVPTRVIAITTGLGKRMIEKQLLPDRDDPRNSDQFAKLCSAFPNLGLTSLKFTADDIRVPIHETADEIDEDAHEASSLDRMGDLILATLYEFANRDDTAICLSISGGRKSMSYLGGIAMTLVGRAQDRLVHVLLNEHRLERALPTFYYPPTSATKYQVPSLIQGGKSEDLYSNKIDCGVTLADVPLLRLGALLPEGLRAENIDLLRSPSLSKYVRLAQDVLTTDEFDLRFIRETHHVICNRVRIDLSQEEFLLLHCIAERGDSGFSTTPSDAEFRAYQQTYRKYARDILAADEATREKDYFVQMKDGVFVGLDDENWAGVSPDRVKKQMRELGILRNAKFSPMMVDIRTKFQKVLGYTLASRVLPPKTRKGERQLRFPENVEIVLAEPLDEKL